MILLPITAMAQHVLACTGQNAIIADDALHCLRSTPTEHTWIQVRIDGTRTQRAVAPHTHNLAVVSGAAVLVERPNTNTYQLTLHDGTVLDTLDAHESIAHIVAVADHNRPVLLAVRGRSVISSDGTVAFEAPVSDLHSAGDMAFAITSRPRKVSVEAELATFGIRRVDGRWNPTPLANTSLAHDSTCRGSHCARGMSTLAGLGVTFWTPETGLSRHELATGDFFPYPAEAWTPRGWVIGANERSDTAAPSYVLARHGSTTTRHPGQLEDLRYVQGRLCALEGEGDAESPERRHRLNCSVPSTTSDENPSFTQPRRRGGDSEALTR